MKNVFELKVTLEHTSPSVWRRLLVPDTLSLYELHHVLQIAFGWKNYHLYSFAVNGKTIGNPELMEDDKTVDDKTIILHQVLKKVNDQFQYEYDFGDSWAHSVKLERISPNDAGIKSPLCMDGRMACPPEDCGGIPGYENLVEVMKSTKHPEYNELVEWLGEPFDSKAFDLQKVNKELKILKKYIREYESRF